MALPYLPWYPPWYGRIYLVHSLHGTGARRCHALHIFRNVGSLANVGTRGNFCWIHDSHCPRQCPLKSCSYIAEPLPVECGILDKFWNVLQEILCWQLWKDRNEHFFERKRSDLEGVIHKSWHWPLGIILEAWPEAWMAIIIEASESWENHVWRCWIGNAISVWLQSIDLEPSWIDFGGATGSPKTPVN